MISMTWPQYLRHECSVDGRVVALTGQQCELMLLLLLSHPAPVMNAQMIEFLWPDPDYEPDWAARQICTVLCNLRQRVGAGLIHTRLGWGYRIEQGAMRLAA